MHVLDASFFQSNVFTTTALQAIACYISARFIELCTLSDHNTRRTACICLTRPIASAKEPAQGRLCPTALLIKPSTRLSVKPRLASLRPEMSFSAGLSSHKPIRRCFDASGVNVEAPNRQHVHSSFYTDLEKLPLHSDHDSHPLMFQSRTPLELPKVSVDLAGQLVYRPDA